jgi:hypothetical protein
MMGIVIPAENGGRLLVSAAAPLEPAGSWPYGTCPAVIVLMLVAEKSLA